LIRFYILSSSIIQKNYNCDSPNCPPNCAFTLTCMVLVVCKVQIWWQIGFRGHDFGLLTLSIKFNFCCFQSWNLLLMGGQVVSKIVHIGNLHVHNCLQFWRILNHLRLLVHHQIFGSWLLLSRFMRTYNIHAWRFELF
jgi:hypothetical protein